MKRKIKETLKNKKKRWRIRTCDLLLCSPCHSNPAYRQNLSFHDEVPIDMLSHRCVSNNCMTVLYWPAIIGRASAATVRSSQLRFAMVCVILPGGGTRQLPAEWKVVGSNPAVDFFFPPHLFLLSFFSFSPFFPLLSFYLSSSFCSFMLAPPLQCSSIFICTMLIIRIFSLFDLYCRYMVSLYSRKKVSIHTIVQA